MVRENGIVKYKRGRKRGSGRTYIIRYIVGVKQKEIRLYEAIDTDASFHSGDRISVDITDDSISVYNNELNIGVKGKKV